MKKFFFPAVMTAAVLLFAFSCNKADSIDNGVQVSEPSYVTLNLRGGMTKAETQTADEAKVNSIQIFIFNGDALDAYKVASDDEITAMKVSIQATAGTRDIYAFVNAPDLSAYSSKANLLAVESLLSDNSSNSYVMSGKKDGENLTASYEGTINVDRYAARVKIEKITRNFTAAALQDVAFQIRRFYLTSAVSNELYSFGAPAAYSWLNASFGADRSLSTDNAFVYNKPSAAISVANKASHTQNYFFYAYADTCTVASGDPVNKKDTRLVVECQIDVNNDGTFDDDEYFTYPIVLGALESNKSYEIKELVLTRLGNHSDGDDEADEGEDDPIESTTMSVNIVVNDWTTVLVGTAGTVTI